MEARKDRKLLRFGLSLASLMTVIGISAIILSQSADGSALALELVVLIMSSTALILAIIQGVAISKQMRAIRRSSKDIAEAVDKLELLVKQEQKQTTILDNDLLLDEILIEVLSDHGIKEHQKLLKSLKTKLAKHS